MKVIEIDKASMGKKKLQKKLDVLNKGRTIPHLEVKT